MHHLPIRGNTGPPVSRVLAALTPAAASRPADEAPALFSDPALALEVINARFALSPLAVEEVHLRRVQLANSRVDRNYERFSRPFLQRLADTLVGKPLLANHAHAALPLGRFYGAAVVPDAAGDWWLLAAYYMRRGSPGDEVARQVDAGVYAYVSISFRGGQLRCDGCDRPAMGTGTDGSTCPHYPGQVIAGTGQRCTMTWTEEGEPVEALEGSLVWLGAQFDAQHRKGLEGETMSEMNPTPSGAAPACACCAVHRREAEEARAAAAAADAQRDEALAAARAAQNSLELARSLIADGLEYRGDLVADVRRLAALVGAEQEAELVCDALRGQGIARLKTLKAEYERRVDAAFPPAPAGRTASPPETPPTPAPGRRVADGRGII